MTIFESPNDIVIRHMGIVIGINCCHCTNRTYLAKFLFLLLLGILLLPLVRFRHYVIQPLQLLLREEEVHTFTDKAQCQYLQREYNNGE